LYAPDLQPAKLINKAIDENKKIRFINN